MTDFGWIVGLVIYAIGRSSMALGANMQRLSLRREQAKEEHERLPKKKQKLLMGGIALYAGSGIFLSIALIFASPTLLAPCGTIIFVANAFFAHFMNDEKFSLRNDGPPIGLIVAGTVAVVISAPKESNDFSNDELIELCKEPSFIAFVVFLVIFIVGMFLTTKYFMNSKHFQRAHGFHAESSSSIDMGEDGAPAAEETESNEDRVEVNPQPETLTKKRLNTSETIDQFEDEAKTSSEENFQENEPEAHKHPMNLGPRVLLWYMSFGMLAGGLGGLNITFTKSILSLIKGEIQAEGILEALKSPFLYGIGFLLAGTYITQMICTTNGLDKTPAMIFVPTQSVTEETIAVLGGLFYFQDFQKFTPMTAAIFTLGEGCTIFATIVLTRSQIKRNGESVEEDSSSDLFEANKTSHTTSPEESDNSDDGVVEANETIEQFMEKSSTEPIDLEMATTTTRTSSGELER